MATPFDSSEFVDPDFHNQRTGAQFEPMRTGGERPASREELDARVAETHQRLSELRRTQEQLERERSALEEARRRQNEFHTGREEMTIHLTRGVGLLEEAEFNARRDSEQMTRTLAGLKEATAKVQAIRDDTWTKDDYEIQLTRALTVIENARMEWNAARLKWPVLIDSAATAPPKGPADPVAAALGANFTPAELFRLGLALTWPVATVGLLILIALLFLLFR